MTPFQTILADEALQQKRQKYKYLSSLRSDKQAFSNRLHALNYDQNADKIVQKSIEAMIEFLEVQIAEITSHLFTIDDQEFKRIENGAARAADDQSGRNWQRISTGTYPFHEWISGI